MDVNDRGEKRFLAIEEGVRESTQSWPELFALFAHAQHQLIVQMTNVLEKKHTRVQALARHIKHPYSQIQEQMQRLDYLQKRLQAAQHSTNPCVS